MSDIARSTWVELIRAVEGRAPLASSRDHGEQHWRAVAAAGVVLAEATPGVDLDILLLFGLFHDSQRENDYTDPGHGRRGADLALEMLPGLGLLSDERLQVLWTACERHTRALPTTDPTLGACWDADRLNLWRVDTIPEPRFLSTDEAKRRIAWAEDLHERNTPWGEVLDMYDALRSRPG